MKLKIFAKSYAQVRDGIIIDLDTNQMTGEAQVHVMAITDEGKFTSGGYLVLDKEEADFDTQRTIKFVSSI